MVKMEVVSVSNRSSIPPPLPPKTRSKVSIVNDAPPAAATTGSTVFVGPSPLEDALPEVQGSNHSQITTTSVNTAGGGHVVKIKINPLNNNGTKSSVVQLNSDKQCESVTVPVVDGCIRINVGSNETDQLHRDEMIQRSTAVTESFIKTSVERSNPYFFYSSFPTGNMVMSSGQCSPSDTLDSGTCSDLDSTPPPLPKKKSSGVTVTVIGAQHKRAGSGSLTSSGAEVDSDDNESNISCDSLNSHEEEQNGIPTPPAISSYVEKNNKANAFLPQGLLQDIRDRSKISEDISQSNGEQLTVETTLQRPIDVKQESCTAKAVIASSPDNNNTVQNKVLVDESTYEDRKIEEKQKAELNELNNEKNKSNYTYEADKYYKFHLNENIIEEDNKKVNVKDSNDDELFAGYKDILGNNGSSTIRSAKGTVRGVKNRVRAGIATFLQINSSTKSYKEKDAGKVVVYTTTMGVVRNTYHQCVKVKQILRTHLVKFEERDVFMSSECQAEIRDRMHTDQILVPQVFVDGQHVGDAETIERLNESGELRRILKPYKSADACSTCQICGGYRLLPCPVCNGSKKSVHRNHFTTEFVALKCMNCDEVGLVRCGSC